ncbi:MAG: hypothetical protein GY835_07510 [bacterium]|nr:hypothetical protein [bacterium]
MERKRFALATALSLTVSVACSAATVHVPAEQPSIQAGIDAASAGDTVLVAAGTYFENSITVDEGVNLISETGLANCVVIDAAQSERVMLVCEGELPVSVKIQGFTFLNGRGTSGAGLYCEAVDITLVNCLFSDNTATTTGGGLYCYYSRFTIRNCEFRGNDAHSGGGFFSIYCWFGSSISDCVFVDNTALRGGGYFDDDDDISLETSLFVGNRALYGGAILASYANLVISNCTCVANSAELGSGFYADQFGRPEIRNSLLAFGDIGPAVHCDGSSVITMYNCDLFGNEGGDWTGCISGQLDSDCNLSADPQFCGITGSGDYTLQSDSPCAPANNDCGVLVGARPVACGEVATEEKTWSALKALY